MEERTWVDRFVRELKREKRAAILEEGISQEGLSPANELRQKLLEGRYGKVKKENLDYFIRGWMRLHYIRSTGLRLFGKKSLEKDKEGIRSDLKLELASSYGEVGEQVLYEEFCNTARLYLHLCRNDRNYGSLFLGLGRMKEESINEKIAKDLYTAVYEVPKQIGMLEELKTFRRAVVAVFCEEYPDESRLLADRIPE